jgi:diguanylate cyclase (GGDEF)-like protein/PAS domain S-box-containing protein
MEELRLAAIRDLALLDTEPEREFDELAQLAATICGTPMSTITLVDEHRQWFKARYGVPIQETPRASDFCNPTIRGDGVFVVEDGSKEKPFCLNPFVTAPNGLRFYAGVPISVRDGLKIGTLCVHDTQPRSLTAYQQETLAILARQVGVHMELRLQRQGLQRALEDKASLIAQLGASDQLFRTFMHYSPMASFIKDDKGRFVYYNQRLANSAGVKMDSAIGLTDKDLWPEEIAQPLQENDRRAVASEEFVEVDETTELAGTRTDWRCFKFPWRNSSGEQMLAGIRIDVTEERQHQAALSRYQAQLEEANIRLTRSANTDPLTGLANRRAFDEGMDAAAGTSITPGQEIALLTIDVDDFKCVNDTFGHAYGDRVLRQIAKVIVHCTLAQDLVARSGGEEFTVMLPASGPATAITTAERILTELREVPWEYHLVTVSIGVSAATIEDRDLSCVLARSDRALYRAKEQGRNRVVYLTKSQDDINSSKLEYELQQNSRNTSFLPALLVATHKSASSLA